MIVASKCTRYVACVRQAVGCPTEELIGVWVVECRTQPPRPCIGYYDELAGVVWHANVLLYCYGYRGWMDVCYDDYCPPYFNGELRVRIGFAGTVVVLFVGHAC